MDVYKTAGCFSWAELSTTDPAAAATFYAQLFGWKINAPIAEMGDYRVVNVGETAVAGIMPPPPGAPAMPPSWGCYVTVADVDQTVAKCQSLGGNLLVPAMDVPGVGRMAVLQDPQGAVLSVMTYAMP
jgi:uncharacterized protein